MVAALRGVHVAAGKALPELRILRVRGQSVTRDSWRNTFFHHLERKKLVAAVLGFLFSFLEYLQLQSFETCLANSMAVRLGMKGLAHRGILLNEFHGSAL